MLRTFILCLLVAVVLCPFRAVVAEEPVQVFILCGQSNMCGHGKTEMGLDPEASEKAGRTIEVEGGLGSLRRMVNDDSKTFGHDGTNPLIDVDGEWLVRKDVYVYSRVNESTKKGAHTTRFGKGSWNGPEYGFGQVVGNAIDKDILIIKIARGGTSLARDWRPPTAVKKRGGEVGPMWKQMQTEVGQVLKNLGTEFPNFAGRPYEIVGFAWHQGFNDAVSKDLSPEYEENLVDLIGDVRAEFGNADLPFVIGTTSMAPPEKEPFKVELAQLAVADAAKYPQLKGTVSTVDTGPFWQDRSISPSGFGYHWNHNGITHYKIGAAMGEAMLKVLSSQ